MTKTDQKLATVTMLENVLARRALMESSVILVPRDLQVKNVKSVTTDSMDILIVKVGFCF